MDLRPGAIPPEGVTDSEAALAATIFRIRGTLFRALVELEKTPKPWPNNVKAARNAMLAGLNWSQGEWNAVPASIREAGIQASQN